MVYSARTKPDLASVELVHTNTEDLEVELKVHSTTLIFKICL